MLMIWSAGRWTYAVLFHCYQPLLACKVSWRRHGITRMDRWAVGWVCSLPPSLPCPGCLFQDLHLFTSYLDPAVVAWAAVIHIHSFFDILDPSFIRCVIFLRWWAPRVLCVLFQHVTLWHRPYTALLVSVVLGQGLQAVFRAMFMSGW